MPGGHDYEPHEENPIIGIGVPADTTLSNTERLLSGSVKRLKKLEKRWG